MGTTYGGDGRTTFALPDLRGRVAISEGTGPGLMTHKLGARSGIEEVTLSQLQLPNHNHLLDLSNLSATSHFQVTTEDGNSNTPDRNYLATSTVSGGLTSKMYSSEAEDGEFLAAGAAAITGSATLALTGGSQAHPNMAPYLNHILDHLFTGSIPFKKLII